MKKTKTQRREDAAMRRANRDGLTPAQQLKNLDDRLGIGVGAAKERERLNAIIGE